MTANQLLSVLKTGARIEWPCEYALKGDLKHGYIDTFIGGHFDGVLMLNLEGTKKALRELKHIEKQTKENKQQ